MSTIEERRQLGEEFYVEEFRPNIAKRAQRWNDGHGRLATL